MSSMAGGLLAGLMKNSNSGEDTPTGEGNGTSLSGLNGNAFQLDNFLANSTAGLTLGDGSAAPPCCSGCWKTASCPLR